MSYQYIILIEKECGLRSNLESEIDAAFRTMGMEDRAHVGRATLFTSRETPTISLPGGAVVIGDLYYRDGTAVTNGANLPAFPRQKQMQEYILANCWGEYLLLQTNDDTNDGTSILRDPSGGIPCGYVSTNGLQFITSDISIAVRLGLYRELIDWGFVAQCLISPHLKVSRTGLTNVRELLPGCSLIFQNDTSITKVEWSPWDYVAKRRRHNDLAEAAKEVLSSVMSVVRAMADTDQTLLLELSGGLDSSIVAACLRGTQARVACCTMVPPLPGADERQYANQMAAYLGIELHHGELSFEQASIDFSLPQHSLRPAVWALGKAVSDVMDASGDHHHVSSFFSGSGGDTVFCYLKTAAPAADAFKERGLAAGLHAIRDLSELHQCTLLKASRLTIRKLLCAPKPTCRADYSLTSLKEGVLAPEQHPWFVTPTGAFPGDRERIFDLAGNQLFRDSTPRRGDRRVRMPLLSQPVMEACLKAPTWMWILDGRNRAVARAAFSDLLPNDILHRRSKGTFMNYTAAVYRRSKNSIRRFLLDGHLQSRGLLDSNALNRHFDSDLPPRDRSYMRIFSLCMIENWVRNHC